MAPLAELGHADKAPELAEAFLKVSCVDAAAAVAVLSNWHVARSHLAIVLTGISLAVHLLAGCHGLYAPPAGNCGCAEL
jgi:hypothetical protein